jgi:dTDP-4-amino-4,6-dideoxygalactose transaminase
MSRKKFSRRTFIKQGSLTGIGTVIAPKIASASELNSPFSSEEPAVLGGNPIRKNDWPEWPQWSPDKDEKSVLRVLREGVWSRDKVVTQFEKRWAETIGTKRCLAVVNGTNALIASLVQMDIGAGDEVIVPPYTWISTIQAVLIAGAMPVFVDTDPETYQIDAEKIEEKITPRTRAILPVHILGMPANMVRIMEIAKKHKLLVLEDACQAWLAEINHQIVGTFGHAGCYSFQTTKHLPLGEGGAIVSDDEEFMDRCYSYHNVGFPYGEVIGDVGAGSVMLGTKLRITEYQAAIGLTLLEDLEEQTTIRNERATYLRSKIEDIPGIVPYKLYDNVTRCAFHMFAFRYKQDEFKGLSRADFLNSLRAEGIPCMSGYAPFLNTQPYIQHAFKTKNFRAMYPEEMLDFQNFSEQNQCPENDALCNEAVWLFQSMLLADESDMDDVANAILKIKDHAESIKKGLKKT